MKISLSFARLLLRLSEGEEINSGEFKGNANNGLLKKFIDDEVIGYVTIGHQRRRIHCKDFNNMQKYLHTKFGIASTIQEYITFLCNEESSRADGVRVASDSKIKKGNLIEGFFVNTYVNLFGNLNGEEISLKPILGSQLFISDYNRFSIPEDVTVVIVEAFENFKFINYQKSLFKDKCPLFIWRYQNSNTIVAWLNTISNPILHYGDFDLKGVHIYISEFRNKLSDGRCNFFIPTNIEDLIIKHGSEKLYNDQYENLKNINFSSYPEIVDLIKIIKTYRKGLEQEILINTIK